MNWPLFTHTAWLAGLAAVAIPIVIHLLLKSRKPRLRFSTLQFFRQQDERSTRRRKLRNWLLLAARILLISLLVLGFARPYLRDQQAAATAEPPRQVILVIDRSLSMLAADREGARWTRAQTAMRELLIGLRSSDRAILIGCSTRAETLFGPGAPPDALKALKDLQPTQGAGNLAEGLQAAGRLVNNASGSYSNIIYVVSDLQRASCRDLAAAPIPRAAEVKLLHFGDLLTPNVAVNELTLKQTETNQPSVTVVNFSDEESPALKLQFAVDGKEASVTPLQLAAGESTNLDLVFPRVEPGWHTAEARLAAKDALGLDNVRYQAFYQPPPVRVLVVEPRPGVKSYEEESFFLVSALDPAFGATNQNAGAFRVRKTSPDGLEAELAPSRDKTHYDAVVLPALKQVPAGVNAALAAFVRSGGGLLLFLGDTVSINHYTADLADFLPARLTEIESATDFDWRLWNVNTSSPIFAAFRRPNSGNVELARFTRRCAWSTFEEKAVLARFQDGMPAMLGRELGQGRILWVNSSADTAWTDWPKHRTFVPWLHGTIRFLTGAAEAIQTQPSEALVVGSEIDMAFGAGLKKARVKLLCPGGKEYAGLTDDTGMLRDCPLSTSGIYSLRDPASQEIRRVAINVPVAESDLVALAPPEFERQLVRSEKPADHSLAAGLFGPANDHRELWRICLLAGFILLFVELWLGNRTLA